MGWIIDEDHISEGARNGCGDKFKEDQPFTKFRLYDDDNELYYSGRINDDWLNGDEEHAFAPLDFGMADAGCSYMTYFEDGEWKHL